MNTLRELGNFVGIPQESIGTPFSLAIVSVLVTGSLKPASMRAIIQILRNLTPITLESEIVGSRSGERGFKPVIRVNASGGITRFTRIEYSWNENMNSDNFGVGPSGGDFPIPSLAPGIYQFVVKRSGISNTGFVSLSKILGTVTVTEPPTPPPTPPPPPSVPIINVELTSIPGSFNQLRVSGSGFSGNEEVIISVTALISGQNPSTLPTPTTASSGRIDQTISVSCTPGLITIFQVQARGASSGKISNTAGATC